MSTPSSRVHNLEQRTQPQRLHGMTHQVLDLHMNSMALREVHAFAETMTDDDLTARIEHLKTIKEHHHASTSKENYRAGTGQLLTH